MARSSRGGGSRSHSGGGRSRSRSAAKEKADADVAILNTDISKSKLPDKGEDLIDKYL